MSSRREFIALLGGAAAMWPLAARAQQPALPVIGLLTTKGAGDTPHLLAAVRQGLKDTGFAEGQNVAIEYRFAGNKSERLPVLAAEKSSQPVWWLYGARNREEHPVRNESRALLQELKYGRNANHTKADWQFTTKNARIKLKHLYPAI